MQTSVCLAKASSTFNTVSFLISHFLLGLPNLLFDRTTNRLSAVLDFDFAHIGAPISE